MKYKNVEFDAIVATPGCGKSYVCDKYPKALVDVDEVRLKCKYVVPEDITRKELEATKGDRPFERRAGHSEYINNLYIKLDQYLEEGKTLIAAPHPEAIDYLVKNRIKFCFVYPNKGMKETIRKRMEKRGNPLETIKSNDDMFDEFYKQNIKEKNSVIHYEFGEDEYLEDILIKFDFKFNNK